MLVFRLIDDLSPFDQAPYVLAGPHLGPAPDRRSAAAKVGSSTPASLPPPGYSSPSTPASATAGQPARKALGRLEVHPDANLPSTAKVPRLLTVPFRF
jgi:hypothetical protein